MESIKTEHLKGLYENAIQIAARKITPSIDADLAFSLGFTVAKIGSVVITAKQHQAGMFNDISLADYEVLTSAAKILMKAFKNATALEGMLDKDQASKFILSIQKESYEQILLNLKDTKIHILIDDDTPEYLRPSKSVSEQMNNILYLTTKNIN